MQEIEESTVRCPHCGEPVFVVLDASQSDSSYIEDCTVCCRPMNIRVDWDSISEPVVVAGSDSE